MAKLCQKNERIVDKISLKIWNHLNDLIFMGHINMQGRI